MLPEIPSPGALAGASSVSIFVGGDHRARLQAITVFVLDGVLLVIENRIQTFVQVRDMVSAIEKVVDEDLPVATDVVCAAVKVMQFSNAQRGNAMREASEKLRERRSVVVEVDEDEALPGFHSNRNQTVLRAAEILDTLELGRPLERTVEAIVPSVVGTMQKSGMSAALRCDGGSVMATNIVKAPANAIA